MMKEEKTSSFNARQEVNLKAFLKRIYEYKILFFLSIFSFITLALIYIAFATTKYEVSASILIDSSGSDRVLGESEYVRGGVDLIEIEKNLYNEVGIIKSFSLVRETIEDLSLDLSYYSDTFLSKTELYGFFPFEVKLKRTEPQIFGVSFKVAVLNDEKYRLTAEADEFTVSNPANGSTREVNRDFEFSEEFNFGEEVANEFFTFTIIKPKYAVSVASFEGDELSFTIQNLDDVATEYMNKLDVNNIDIQASILKIVSTGADVDKEKDFLTKLTENYISNQLLSRNRIASSKEDFIRDQLRVISDSLVKVELNLESFKKDKQAINLGVTATNALNQAQDLQVEGAKIRLDIKYYNTLIQNVENNRNNDDFVIPSATGINDPLLNRNIIELQRLYGEKSKKRFFVTNSNEEMSMLDDQIKESTDFLLNNLRNAVQSSRFALQRVNSQTANYNEQISTLPEQENKLLSIQRKSTLYENLFNYLSQELAKTGIARAESTSDTRILDEARMVGDGPVAPQKPLVMTLALTLGLLLPMIWVVVFAPNDAIENIEQIVQNTEIPVIASIVHYDPQAKNGEVEETLRQLKETLYDLTAQFKVFGILRQDANSGNSVEDIALWTLKESFRDLSVNLKLINSRACCVLGFTSIMPEEGKTYNAINLGITLAEAGYRTLIIDTDLRKPSLVAKSRKVEGKGLSNYLEGDVDLIDDIIYPHEKLRKLDFIPTTATQGNVQRLLAGTLMPEMISELKPRYDYILLDTPAVGLVSDFLLLWDSIDINLFVVRRNLAKIKFLDDIEKLVPNEKLKSSYIIFNDALKKSHKYGYGAKYGSNSESQLVDKQLTV